MNSTNKQEIAAPVSNLFIKRNFAARLAEVSKNNRGATVVMKVDFDGDSKRVNEFIRLINQVKDLEPYEPFEYILGQYGLQYATSEINGSLHFHVYQSDPNIPIEVVDSEVHVSAGYMKMILDARVANYFYG